MVKAGEIIESGNGAGMTPEEYETTQQGWQEQAAGQMEADRRAALTPEQRAAEDIRNAQRRDSVSSDPSAAAANRKEWEAINKKIAANSTTPANDSPVLSDAEVFERLNEASPNAGYYNDSRNAAAKRDEDESKQSSAAKSGKHSDGSPIIESKKELDNLDGIIKGLDKRIEEKYSGLIKDGEFTGSETEWASYKRDVETRNDNILKYNITAKSIDSKAELNSAQLEIIEANVKFDRDNQTTEGLNSAQAEMVEAQEKMARDTESVSNYKAEQVVNTALKDLDRVKIDKGPVQVNAVTGERRGGAAYDIGKYLRTGGDEKNLTAAGFNRETIEAAKKENSATMTLNEFQQQYFADRGVDFYPKKAAEMIAVNMGLQGKVYIPEGSDLTDTQKRRDLWEKSLQEYKDKYGDGAFFGSVAGEILATSTVPAAKAIEPGGWKNVSASDWAWTAGIVALTVVSMGASKTISGLKFKLSPVSKAAKSAGEASTAMDSALSRLNKTAPTSVNFSKTSAKAQAAVEAARAADTKFVNELNRVSAISQKELRSLEKTSKIKGLTRSVNQVNKAQDELGQAWDELDRAKFGTEEYSKKLNNLSAARTNLDKAMDGIASTLTPRNRGYLPAAYEGALNSTDKKLAAAQKAMLTIEGRIKEAALPSKKAALQVEWLEAKQEADAAQFEKQALLMAKHNGIPAPNIKKYLIKLTPTEAASQSYDKQASKVSNWINDQKKPLKDMSRMPEYKPGEPIPKTVKQSATRKAVVTTQERQKLNLELEPVYEKATAEKPKVRVPKTKLDDNRMIPIKPSSPQVTQNGQRVGAMTPEQARRLMDQDGETIINAIGHPINRSGLSESQKSAIITITERSIQEASILNARKLTSSELNSKIKEIVSSNLKSFSNSDSAPDTRSKAQFKAAEKALTKTVTQTINQTKTKTETKEKSPEYGEAIKPIKLNGKPSPTGFLTEAEIKSAVAVQMGQVVHVFKAPYRQQDVIVYKAGRQPAGIKTVQPGNKKASPYATVQLYVGKQAPRELKVDVGIQDMTIRKPSRPGTPGTIDFRPDPRQLTKLPLTIKGAGAGGSNGMVSIKRNRQYVTKSGGGGNLISRQPIKGARVKGRRK